jgi:hypothetical protein
MVPLRGGVGTKANSHRMRPLLTLHDRAAARVRYAAGLYIRPE